MSSPVPRSPLKVARLASLSIAWCTSVIAASVGLNALIKSNQEKSALKKLAPPPATVTIDTSDIFNVGVLATTVCLVLAIILSKFIISMSLPSSFNKLKLWFEGKLRIGAFAILLFCCILFGAMVPYMIYFMNRAAVVKGFIGTTQLPDSVVKAVEARSGATSVYKEIFYLRLLAIFPWIALFFNLIAAAVLLKASKAVANHTHTTESEYVPSSPSTDMKSEVPTHIDEKGEQV